MAREIPACLEWPDPPALANDRPDFVLHDILSPWIPARRREVWKGLCAARVCLAYKFFFHIIHCSRRLRTGVCTSYFYIMLDIVQFLPQLCIFQC